MNGSAFSLPQLQNWMQGMLVHHAPLAIGGIGKDITDVINQSARLSAIGHLDIYRHSYIARLRACMKTQFGALAYALGDELFEAFADQYLDNNPSASYTLNTLGEKFPAFLEETRPDAGLDEKENWPDFMIELARFEYALSEIFDEHYAGDILYATDDTHDEQLKAAPLLRLFHHRFPVCRFYLGFCQGKLPDLPFPGESFCAVARRNYQLGLFTIRGSQHCFLSALQQGMPVDQAKQSVLTTFNADSNELDRVWPEWKRNFIASGFLCRQ